jgi:hypothetical protein
MPQLLCRQKMEKCPEKEFGVKKHEQVAKNIIALQQVSNIII